MIWIMQDERLRLLALWHGLRRDVDTLLLPLLSHGPVAVTRVSERMVELESAVQRERAAFEAFRTACQQHVTVPTDELARGRARSRLSPAEALDLVDYATVIQLPERP